MRRVLLIVLLLAAVAAGIYAYEPARITAMVLLGRTAVCDLNQALEAPNHLKRQIEFKDRILAGSKKLQVDAEGFELWDTPKGKYWIPKGSHYVLPFNLAEQERDIYTLGDIRIQKGDVVLDCGANIGVYTRKALDEGAGKVIAIEPAPENVHCLRQNFAKEIEEGRVVVYPKGVWDKDDVLTFHVDPNNSAADSFLIERKDHVDVVKIPVTTIDHLVAELNLEKVSFVKMDIEGAEVRALHGGRETIAKNHPRMALSAYHVPTDPVEIPKAVLEAWAGYSMKCGPCAIEPRRVRPDVLFFY